MNQPPAPPPPLDSPPPDYNTAVSGPQNPIGPRGSPPALAVAIDLNEPPPEYSVAAHLPTYEQAELSKDKLYVEDLCDGGVGGRGGLPPHHHHHHHHHHPGAGGVGGANSDPELLDPRGDPSVWDEDETADAALLGNDFVFCTAFVTAFLFNWVGFLLLMCFCHTIAARYGALAGFGLSLAKWTLIVKRSTDLVRNENAWLWWLVLGFGFLICTRACVQYLQIKKTWRQLSRAARERLFFFY